MAELTQTCGEITEGTRVTFDDTGTVYLCVGRNDSNYYFQDENGTEAVLIVKTVNEIEALLRGVLENATEPPKNDSSLEPPKNDSSLDCDRSKWTHEAILCLIKSREELESKFASPRFKKRDVWREVAQQVMHATGMHFSFHQVETKWKNLTKRYRDTVDHNRISGNDRKTCPYFDELDEWYGHKPGVEPSVTATTSPAGRRVSPRKRSSSVQSAILNVVKEMSADNKRMEEERLKVARQMHSEKMKFFGDFLEVLKGQKEKNNE